MLNNRRMNYFASYHPINQFLYYMIILAVTMFFRHPVLLALSVTGAATYGIWMKRGKVGKFFLMVLPVCIVSAVVNPLFSHEGVTILGYFSNGNPVTLESILYGLSSGVMLAAVFLWFYTLQEVMTSDKFIYLFGRLLPVFGLILSMVFQFVPKYRNQIRKISDAQKGIGRDIGNGNLFQRIRQGMKIMSILATWAFENSVETADSMKSRGYGLRGRTSYSIYRFESRDRWFLGIQLVCILPLVAGNICEWISVQYYPVFLVNENTWFSYVTYFAYGILCFLPVISDVLEEIKWHYIQSKI